MMRAQTTEGPPRWKLSCWCCLSRLLCFIFYLR
ncbi:hypothetical protein SGPA1_22101 [Streptomyces misionensis JCM 4497]